MDLKPFGISAIATTNQDLLAEIKQAMLASGWCPHRLDYLAKVYSLEAFVFLSHLSPLPPRQAVHRRCIEHQTCVAFDTDERKYQPAHLCADNDCALVEIDQEALAKVIRAGKIPLLSIEFADDGNGGNAPILSVHARSRRTKYVAISHVWADGLGNPYRCALPSCQLRLLQARLLDAGRAASSNEQRIGLDRPCARPSTNESITHPRSNHPGNQTYFWIDTLCIPVLPQMSTLRLAQIDAMASIYLGSTTTLVLDAELMATNFSPDSDRSLSRTVPFTIPCQLRARIISCAWMSRSWTLQEGALAPSLTFQLKNAAVGLGTRIRYHGPMLLGNRTSDRGPYEEWIITDQAGVSALLASSVDPSVHMAAQRRMGHATIHMGSCSPSVCEFQSSLKAQLFNDNVTDIVKVWNALAGRNTTKPEDLPLILANLLDLKTYQLVRYGNLIDPYETIFRSLDRIPFSLLFGRVIDSNQPFSHHSSWIPSEIGKELLPNRDFLETSGEYLMYYYSPSSRSEPQGILMYTCLLENADDFFRYLYDSTNDIYYLFESRPFRIRREENQAPFQKAELCIVLDHEISANHPLVRRGACCVVHAQKTLFSPAKLDFCGGFVLRTVATPSPNDLDVAPILKVSLCSIPQTLAVRIGQRPRAYRPSRQGLHARIAAIFHAQPGGCRIPHIGRSRNAISRLELCLRYAALGMVLGMFVLFMLIMIGFPGGGRLKALSFATCTSAMVLFFAAQVAPTDQIRAWWRLRALENIARERSRMENAI